MRWHQYLINCEMLEGLIDILIYYIICLSGCPFVCLSVRLDPINVQTVLPIGNYMELKITKKLCPKVFSFKF